MTHRSAWLFVFASLTLAACTGNGTPSPANMTDPGADSTATSTAATGTVQVDPNDPNASIHYTQVPGVAMPPWGAPTDVSDRIKAAGLDKLQFEGSFEHIHQHLDVYYNGQPVTVPAFIGIDPAGAFISPLHTHTPDGILHIESPTSAKITLGQLFIEWNVPLTGATAYLAGKQVADPASIVLADHQEIAVVFGTPPAKIPSAFYGVWPDGTSLAMPATGTP